MAVPAYEYLLENCDVPAGDRKRLKAYRDWRLKCLTYLYSDGQTSVASQIGQLAWHTAVFKTLNEARKLEPHRRVNSMAWSLILTGYVTIAMLGIRKLVDRDENSDSLWHVLDQLERRPEQLIRQNFVCYDGAPYDDSKAFAAYADGKVATRESAEILPEGGPTAWSNSMRLHKIFDRLCKLEKGQARKKRDRICPTVIADLKARIDSPVIKRVSTMVSKKFAHAERIDPSSPLVQVSLEDVTDSLRIITKVANFVSATIFNDAIFHSVVPLTGPTILDHIDEPWIEKENVTALTAKWREICREMDDWVKDIDNYQL